MGSMFATYVQAGLFGSIIILLILLLRLFLRRAPRQLMCILWMLAAVRFLLPFQLESVLSLQPTLPQAEESVLQQPEHTPGDTPVIPDAGVGETPMPDDPAQDTPPADLPQDVIQSDAPNDIETAGYKEILSVIWISVAGVLLVYTAVSYVLLRYKVRFSVKCGDNIMECSRINSAFVLGYLQPRIYLPSVVEEQDRVHIIAHERAHIARGDNWWKLIGFLCVCLHWYNPLVWVAYTLFCRDTEVACDERVVWQMDLKERKEYSLALLNSGKHISGLSAVTLCFGRVSLAQRIKNVLSYRKPGLWITAVAGMLVVFISICFLTTPRIQPREIPEPTESQLPTEALTEAPTETPTQPPTDTPTEPPTQPPTEPGAVASGTCGQGLMWSLSNSGVLTVSGNGAMTNYDSADAQPWKAYRGAISSVNLGSNVTMIGDYAFGNCEALRSVAIPKNIEIIGRYAFGGCTGLSTVTFASGSRIHTIGRVAFANTAIREFVAPTSLRIIQRQAFSGCSALQSVSLTGGVHTVEEWAFENCTGLRSIVVGSSVTQIDRTATFQGCSAIEKLEINTDAMAYFWNHQKQLKELRIGGTVTQISGFSGCNMLTRVTISAPSATILELYDNSSLQELVFLSDAPAIREIAFRGLKITVYYPANNPTWTADIRKNYGGTVTWVPVE